MNRKLPFPLNTDRVAETYDHLDTSLERQPNLEVMKPEHVALLLKPLLEPLVKESERLRADLHILVDDIYKGRVFDDTPVLISANVAYEVNYHERRFLYVFTSQTVTLTLSTGNTVIATVNNWTPINFPKGTKLTAASIPDTAPLMITVRACDYPIAMFAELLNGVATIGNVGLNAGTNNIGNVGSIGDYPAGATPVNATSGNIANNVAAATLPATAGKTTYLTGFEVTGSGATAALVVTVTVTGAALIASYTYSFALGVTVENTPLIIEFTKPISSGAANTTIVVSCPASGAGGTNNVVNAHGYQL